MFQSWWNWLFGLEYDIDLDEQQDDQQQEEQEVHEQGVQGVHEQEEQGVHEQEEQGVHDQAEGSKAEGSKTENKSKKHRKKRKQKKTGKKPAVKPSASVSATPKAKALIIGINYKSLANKSTHLSGCINDAQRMYTHACQQFEQVLAANSKEQCEVRVLCDETPKLVLCKHPRIKTRVVKSKPTRSAIERAVRWLATGASAESNLWISYSGHGINVVDRNGDEQDHMDEALVPLDYQSRGLIVDDWMNSVLVNRLPAGAKLFAVFDCCNSGTALDLQISLEDKSVHNEGKKASEIDEYKKEDWRLVQQRSFYNKSRAAKADVVMFSGCRDNQTSADAWEDRASTGALTYAFLKFYKESETLEALLQNASTWLAVRGYEQRPLLSFGSAQTEQKMLRKPLSEV